MMFTSCSHMSLLLFMSARDLTIVELIKCFPRYHTKRSPKAPGTRGRLIPCSISHWGPAKKAKPAKAGSHYLHYDLNNLNAATSPAVT